MLVEVIKVRINLVVEVNIPKDIVKDESRFGIVKEGIIKSMSKGLYEEGIDFRIINSTFE
ncbi:MAG: hypothetical protein M3162_08345 [Thermoproteota archaeon]|nr:hypothetical protein [Thermoproteota archaeon]